VLSPKRDSLSISSPQPVEITRANRPAVPDMSANSGKPGETISELLDSAELAARLRLPESWIRAHTRERTPRAERLPCVRLGRYVRFEWSAVQRWLAARVSQ
jgi:hypothetical protein